MERPLARFLRAVGPFGIERLDDARVELGAIERSRDRVVEQVRPRVQSEAIHVVVLEEDLAEPHVGAALDLPLDQHRRQRAAAIVRGPDVRHRDDPGLLVDLDFGDARGERVGGRCADRAAAIVAAEIRRVVGTGRAERLEARLGDLERLRARDHLAAIVAIEDEATDELHALGRDPPLRRDRRLHLVTELARRVDRRVADHEGDARAVGAEVDGTEIAVGRDDAHVLDAHPELFRDDVGRDGVAALAQSFTSLWDNFQKR